MLHAGELASTLPPSQSTAMPSSTGSSIDDPQGVSVKRQR